MSFMISIMYGEVAKTKRFRFYSESSIAEEMFDKAVKDINEIYHTNGRFKTMEEVINHFAKYGFSRIE